MVKDALISQEYQDNIAALAADPVVLEMEKSLPADIDVESWDFIRKADAEYARRGGAIERTHIGAVAHAIARIRTNR